MYCKKGFMKLVYFKEIELIYKEIGIDFFIGKWMEIESVFVVWKIFLNLMYYYFIFFFIINDIN